MSEKRKVKMKTKWRVFPRKETKITVWNWQKEGLFEIPNPYRGTLPELMRIHRYRKILTDIEKIKRRIRRRENWLKFKKRTNG